MSIKIYKIPKVLFLLYLLEQEPKAESQMNRLNGFNLVGLSQKTFLILICPS